MIEKITDYNLERYDSRLKEWCDRKFFEKGNYGKYETTKEASAVAFYPVSDTPLEGKVKFSFKETPPAEGEKGPENPSTITGVSSVGVGCLGKNLFFLLQNQTKSGVTCTINEDGSITLDGTASETITFVTYVNSISSILGKSWFSSGSKINCYYEKISGTATVGSSNGFKIQMSCPSRNGTSFYPGATQDVEGVGATWVATDDFRILSSAIQIYQGMSFSNYRIKIQFELDSVHTNFENFIIANYTIQLGDTYYGGSIDVATGVMTVTWDAIALDGTETWTLDSSSTSDVSVFRCSPSLTHLMSANQSASNRVCSHFSYGSTVNSFSTWGAITRIYIRLPATSYPDESSLTSWLAAENSAGHPVVISYKVNEAYAIQLSTTQIFSLTQFDKYTPRLNTVYTDTDSVQISYLKSPIRDEYEKTQAILSLGGNS